VGFCAPQWEPPIADDRKAFRDLWTPALTGEPIAIARREDMTVPGTAARRPVPSWCAAKALEAI